MKRIVLYCLLLIGVLLVPVQRLDIATLRPVQTVAVILVENGYCVATDTGDLGTGKDLESALDDLKQTTPGVIYLDTADFLLVGKGAEEEASKLKPQMAKSVQVYRLIGRPDLKEVSEYLQVHGSGKPIEDWWPEVNLPVLDGSGERLKLL